MTENIWVANVFMVCPAESLDSAMLFASQMSGNPKDNTKNFFSIPLSTDGKGVTHWGAHTRIRKVVLDQLPAIRTMFPGAIFCITNHDDESVVTTTVASFMRENQLLLFDEDFVEKSLAEPR